jgi:exopolyphosphatase/guanosine-5'-triphosphate,3'-diphosphate pyrophosphatase
MGEGYHPRVNTAAIDIGTNTLLLLIVDETGKALVDLCRFGRLGQGLDATGRLAADAIVRSLEICDEYRRVLNEHGVARPAVIATQATREAANAPDFVGPAEAILGAPIEVIAGTREAELAFLAVARTFPELAGTPYVVVDVGGGSTEFIVTDGTRVTSAVSVPIGSVRLTERHLRHDPPTPDEARSLVEDIDRVLAPLALPRVTVIATAGTATTIAALKLELATYDPDAVTGVHVSRPEVDAQLARLFAATVEQRKAMRGMEAPRADVIAAGVAIYARVLERTGSSLITCDRGIRWGIAYEQLASTASGPRASPQA